MTAQSEIVNCKSQIVVLGCDANPDYLFPLPMTAALWRKAGWRVRVLLCGPAAGWCDGAGKVAIGRLVDVDAEMVLVRTPEACSRPTTVPQLARLYAAAWSQNPDEYLLTADADMWPMPAMPQLLARGARQPGSIDCYGGDAYDHEPKPKVPICYIGAPAGTWRTLMNLAEGQDATEAMGRDLREHLAETAERNDPDEGFSEWCFDERYMGALLTDWRAIFTTVNTVLRFPDKKFWTGGPGSGCVGRIDRGDWRQSEDLDNVIDAHLDRPGWTERNWGRYGALLAAVAPEVVGLATEYREQFIRAMESAKPCLPAGRPQAVGACMK